ncbi:uncharacterized protein N7515_008892 [Penicillium bovifimosum]|uniref:Protein kinase domain-containing protein n=1 Tax=Penicillium bovifimosum TaxID=126998 RepID=A0A9W9KXX4_9EURO|nr:uncharacterized protein N7515_008892 [Penicillium bovifimosum]KAJ5125067.1 hypothetical protein N7515_008892 [Penicillium bovifimosum]
MGRLRYTLGPFRSSIHDKDSQLNVFVSNKHFQIELKAANFEKSPTLLADYLQYLEHLEPDYLPESDEELDSDPLEELAEWALECFLPILRGIPPLDIHRKYTLHDCLFPEVFHYSLGVHQDKLSPIFLDKVGEKRFLGALLPEQLDYSTFPIYRSDQIEISIPDESNSLPAVPRKVYIQEQHNQVAFLKSVSAGDVNSTCRELSAYTKIQSALFSKPIYASRLLGIVRIPSSGRIVGLLLSYIEFKDNTSDYTTLLCVGKGPQYVSMRQKWLSQITQSIEGLHACGAVWGDAKPDNVLIDTQLDAYLIDFGGGYTRGWVDKELANTAEGDLQGLKRISEFLE